MSFDHSGVCPAHFRELFPEDQLQATGDGCWVQTTSLAELLLRWGIDFLIGSHGQQLACGRYFDDWHLYAVPRQDGHVYSLFKLREQEYDAEQGIAADGDTPGATISFLALDMAVLRRCLEAPTEQNRAALFREIDRVVAARGARHHPALKAYFDRVSAEAPYLMAELYVRHAASFARDGSLPVPKAYAAIYEKDAGHRLPVFLEQNNRQAGRCICDHRFLFFQDPAALTHHEKLAILATHTANTSFFSFAAEVQFHARFLVWYARVPLPFLGRSVYDSAVRADLTIDDREEPIPMPFHDPNSRWVRRQQAAHSK